MYFETAPFEWDYYSELLERVAQLAAGSAVVVFSKSGCCMCHAVKRLLCDMGVNPSVVELDLVPMGRDMEISLAKLIGNSLSVVPMVFVGGKMVGSMDRVLGCHISGNLVPLLKQAGALWL